MQANLCEIPAYLRSSSYFRSFNKSHEGDEGRIIVPLNCFKPSMDINLESDLVHLLDTIRFWLVPELIEDSVEFLRFTLNPVNKDFCLNMFNAYEAEIPHLTVVKKVLLAHETAKMKIAAEAGATRLLSYMHETCNLPVRVDVLVAAASNGHIDSLKYLLRSQAEYRHSSAVTKAAAGNNHLACLKLIIREGGKMSTSVTAAAAAGGHLECLRYLRGQRCPWDASTTRNAAHNGHLHCLQYAIEEGCAWRVPAEQFYRDVRLAGMRHGQLACLQYMCSIGYAPFSGTVTEFASLGNLPCVQLLLDRGTAFEVAAIIAAMRGSHLDCVECLCEHMNHHHFTTSMQLCNEAAKQGLGELLMHFRTMGCQWGAETVLAAATAGNFECLSILVSNGCEIHPSALVAAASACSVPCMVLLSEAGCPWTSLVLNAAMRADDADCLEYALPHCPHDPTMVTRAMQGGSTNCLRLLHTIHVCPWTPDLPVQAVELGSLKVLTFLHESGCPWDERTCTAAAVARNSACFNYAYASGCPCLLECARHMLHMRWFYVDNRHPEHFNEEAVVRAAGYETPLYLRYLHQMNTPWDGHAAIAAARDNRVANLQYLHTNGCMWDENAFRMAVMNGHVECVRYMFENNCPFDFMQATCLAAQCGHVEVLQYMRERRLPWSCSTTAAAAVGGHLQCLRYLHEAGCPWDHDTCIRAGTVECYTYAAKNGCPGAHLNPLFATL